MFRQLMIKIFHSVLFSPGFKKCAFYGVFLSFLIQCLNCSRFFIICQPFIHCFGLICLHTDFSVHVVYCISIYLFCQHLKKTLLPILCFKYFMLFNPQDYTTVFLSYDEPNCEENYRHLLSLNPLALRVHGVKGSDTAHKEVAKLSKTDSVIVIDGDNFVKPSFFSSTFELPESYNPKTNVLSFSAYNIINGLAYGNGGIKVWPVSLLNSMQTHENGTGVDFDLSLYTELDIVASEIHFASNYQAFRAGFREGIKLHLDNIDSDQLDYRNFDRIWFWCHVGSDMPYGKHAIFGTRLAIHKLLTEMFDCNSIIDVDNIKMLYKESTIENNQLFYDVRARTNNWFFGDVLTDEDSKRVRDSHINPSRTRDSIDTEFLAWAHHFRLGAKLNNQNELNKLCTIGRSLPYGTYRLDGAIMGREFRKQNGHDFEMLSKVFDYSWLKQEYDRLYTNSI